MLCMWEICAYPDGPLDFARDSGNTWYDIRNSGGEVTPLQVLQLHPQVHVPGIVGIIPLLSLDRTPQCIAHIEATFG